MYNADADLMTQEERAHLRLQRQGHRAHDQMALADPALQDAPQSREASILGAGVSLPVETPAPGIGSALLGVGVSPRLAGSLRAIAYIVLMAVGNGVLIYLQVPPVWLLAYSGIISGAIRAIEGVLDQYLKGSASAAAPNERIGS